MEFRTLANQQIEPGDVLLCYSAQCVAKTDELKNGYSHAAICTHELGVVESSATGIKQTSIQALLEEYGHIAVLRNKTLWNQERLIKLDTFAKSKIGKLFNKAGMFKLPERKHEQKSSQMERIEGYFEGTYVPPSHDRNVYFCSEFITAAFVNVGIINEAASIILSPDTFSPEDIGRDKAFGFFVGYLISYECYEVPESDTFRHSI